MARKRKLILWAVIILGSFWVYQKVGSLAKSKADQVKVEKTYTKAQTVCVDAGHGGEDAGASNNDITEAAINLTVALKLQTLLEDQGYQVFMTRTTADATLSNNDRYTYCNAKKATILVSVHHNYYEDSVVDYGTALYYKPSDQALATSILGSVATKLNITNNDITEFEDGVLSKSTMPAALSEAFFLTSDDEYNLLAAAGSTRLDDEAQAIDAGIINYFAAPPS